MAIFKDWDALEIRDNYLFQRVMRNQRLCKALLEKILGIKIRDIAYPQTEKTSEAAPLSKSVRLDVYVEDDAGTVYNIEMQTTEPAGTGTLAKRIRYYGAQIDMGAIEKGQKYSDLPTTFIIFICTFDPFREKRSIYTFRKLCVEHPTLEIGDMATTIFLCTNGSEEGVDPDIISFLKYVDGKAAEGKFTQDFAAAVEEIKEHVEMRREYMTLMMEIEEKIDADLKERVAKERDSWIEQGIEQGIERGREENQLSALQNLINGTGWSLEKAMDILQVPSADRARYAAMMRH